jgi:hypothetical protein
LSLELTDRLLPTQFASAEQAILETLAYSDIFEYPLCIEEIHRYLPMPVDVSDLINILKNRDNHIGNCDGYYFLAGREPLIALRKKREMASRPIFRRAVRFGQILGALPFIRMVGLTGSLAHLNCDEHADIDYLLVTTHGRLWLARAFAVLLGRLASFMGNTLCPNLIVSEEVLEWEQRDLYSARELCQMIPITGMDVYARLRQANSWTNIFLPNASEAPFLISCTTPNFSIFQNLGELPLRGFIGDRLEAWEMNRKIKRFTHQAGYGVETLFSADICQGNFNHHGLQTKEAYKQRLAKLGLSLKVELHE